MANRWPIDNHTKVVATHWLSSIGVKKLGIPRSSMYLYALAVRTNVWDDLNLFTGLFMLQFNIQFERQIITNVSVLRWFLIFLIWRQHCIGWYSILKHWPLIFFDHSFITIHQFDGQLRTDIVIKSYAHVLHDVSITIVKEIKFYHSFLH